MKIFNDIIDSLALKFRESELARKLFKSSYHKLLALRKSNRRKKFHKHGLELIERFHQCMVDKNVPYTLAFGTLLGAVRDKTFIDHASRQHNFGEDEEKGYTVIYTDGSHEFIKNKVNTRYRVIDVAAERAGLHLMDELREIDADGRYKVKVRVHAPQAAMKSVDKTALLDAGATKVELIADDEEMLEVAASSLFEKFDSHRIRETYEEFCREKQIDDVAIGLEYLSKIEGQCGN